MTLVCPAIFTLAELPTFFIGLILCPVLVTDGCPACVTVDPLSGPDPDDLAGVYK